MLYFTEEYPKAIDCLKRVVARIPDAFEALKMLGSVYLHTKKPDLAEQPLLRATKLRPDDYACWIDLAVSLERKDVRESLRAYGEAINHIQRQKASVPQEIWNNLGVLRHRCGDYPGARDAYMRAIVSRAEDTHGIPADQRAELLATNYQQPLPQFATILSQLNEDVFYIASNVTVAFNLARLAEDLREDKQAELMYKKYDKTPHVSAKGI